MRMSAAPARAMKTEGHGWIEAVHLVGALLTGFREHAPPAHQPYAAGSTPMTARMIAVSFIGGQYVTQGVDDDRSTICDDSASPALPASLAFHIHLRERLSIDCAASDLALRPTAQLHDPLQPLR